MKIVFLPRAQRDLVWFRRYYERVFPEGAQGAQNQYRRALAILRNNPEIGHPTDEGKRVFVVLHTPFSFEYRIANSRIEVLRVRDGRADR
ncbi:MAG: type II toxin-antitoxin system RelE/ParE family toxin [Rhizobiaceae bacterium]